MIEEDSIALRIASRLKDVFPEIEFKELDALDNIHKEGKDLIIMDCVKGIKKVILVENTEQIEFNKIYTMHDFDIGFNLKLMKKTGMINSVKIIGLPEDISENKAVTQASEIIKSISTL